METLVMIAMDPDDFDGVEFFYFPDKIRTSDQINWTAQETTIGVKPLFYANREPRKLEFEELWLDNTESGESLALKIVELRRLFEETKFGTPTKLLIGWGTERYEVCVLETMTIEEVFFSTENEPLRAKVSMTLLEIQFEGVTTSSVRVIDE